MTPASQLNILVLHPQLPCCVSGCQPAVAASFAETIEWHFTESIVAAFEVYSREQIDLILLEGGAGLVEDFTAAFPPAAGQPPIVVLYPSEATPPTPPLHTAEVIWLPAESAPATLPQVLPLVVEKQRLSQALESSKPISPVQSPGATAPRPMQADLLAGGEELTAPLAAIPALVWRTDGNGRCDYLNPAWFSFTGWDRGNGAAHWLEAVHPEDYARVKRELQQAFSANQALRSEFRLRRSDGDFRQMICLADPLRQPDGTLGGYLGVCQDIESQHQAEQAVLRLAHRLRSTAYAVQQITRHLQPEELHAQIIETTGEIFGTCRTYLYLYHDGELLPAGLEEANQQIPEMAHQAVQNHRQIMAPGSGSSNTNSTKPAGVQQVYTPIEHHGRILGVLALKAPGPDALVQADLEALHILTTQIATTLENARLFKAAETQLKQLQALRHIETEILAGLDLNQTLDLLLVKAVDLLDVAAAAVLLVDQGTGRLICAARRGFLTGALRFTNLPLGSGFAGRAALENKIVFIPRLSQEPQDLARSPELPGENFTCYVGVPLVVHGELKGVLELFARQAISPDESWFNFAEALGNQAALVIERATLYEQLRTRNAELSCSFDSLLERLAQALELRRIELPGHSRQLVELTAGLARRCGIDPEELVHYTRGALLHDIGKIGIPDDILEKAGPLNDQEWAAMRRHPLYAAELLKDIPQLLPSLVIPRCHHEKWDGSGYPEGLQGQDIPRAARIFAVVDVYDALTHARPFRPAWPEEQAIAYLQEQSGAHFDPDIVAAFLELLAEQPAA